MHCHLCGATEDILPVKYEEIPHLYERYGIAVIVLCPACRGEESVSEVEPKPSLKPSLEVRRSIK